MVMRVWKALDTRRKFNIECMGRGAMICSCNSLGRARKRSLRVTL